MIYKITLLTILLLFIILYLIDDNKKVEGFSNPVNASDIHYVFWTGGFDSTFRLCEMLINEKKTVQPIYINFNLDNACKDTECNNKLWLRRNRKQENNAMKKIKNMIFNKFPDLKDKLLPTEIVDNDIEDENFNTQFYDLFYSNNLWPRKRKTHQYYYLSKYAAYHKKKIDTGVLGLHRNSKFVRYLDNHLVQTDTNWVINNNSSPISYLNFPLFNRTKEMLLDKAKMFLYDDILSLTWSCWFPKKGKPCGKCPMCKERIINHPTLNDNDKEHLIETFEDEPTYLYWTGGFDSTFRLCQLLLDKNKRVQTIYISDPNIDNNVYGKTKRHSTNKEINSMKKIRNYLVNKYPEVVNLLLPTKNIKKIKISKNIKDNMKTLYKLDKVRRPTCQYGAMAQHSHNINKDIEVCIGHSDGGHIKDGTPRNTLHNALKGKLKCNYSFCSDRYKKLKSNLNKWEQPLEIFKHFIFPLYHMDKKEMYMYAKDKGYHNVLKLTWSCWYPLHNGKPCGKCIMCKERVI
tara:strand:- start:249 stop:1799 length:1551 start_codon:yes stop_codon:yes gene_type:complete